jgi:hypothetical protein
MKYGLVILKSLQIVGTYEISLEKTREDLLYSRSFLFSKFQNLGRYRSFIFQNVKKIF